MSTPQFESREEFEAYLADPERDLKREVDTKTSAFLWKIMPTMIGGFAIGLALMIYYPKWQATNDSLSTQEKKVERYESFLSWLGLDVNKFRREHQQRMDELSSANKVEMPDVGQWNHFVQ